MHIEGAGISAPNPGLSGTALMRLMTWLSPSFPIGAFSYSHGLETAIADGTIYDRDSARAWLQSLMEYGGGWSDAVLLAQSWKAAESDLEEVLELNDLALAMSPSAERHLETTQQGNAFLKASRAWPVPFHDKLDQTGVCDLALPVIIGAIGRAHHIPLDALAPASLHAFLANLVSVAIRLVPLGQSDGLTILADLEQELLDCAERAQKASLDEIGTCCLQSDIAAMRHETLTTRIFRS